MSVRILHGDCRRVLAPLPAESVHCVVTSPPVEVLAYSAGVLDSDGSIGIRRSTYAMRVRGDSGQPVFSARVCVKQVTPEAVTLLKEAFRIKKAQAENCINLYALVEQSKRDRVAIGRGHAGSAARDLGLTSRMEVLYARAKELNAVGVRP